MRYLQESLVKDFGYKDDEVIEALQECLAGKGLIGRAGEKRKHFCDFFF